MTKRRRRNKKWVSRLFILVLLIAAGAVCYLVWENYFKDKSAPEPEQPAVVETKKTDEKKIEEKKEETAPVVEKEKIPQYDGEDPNEASGITGVVTYAGIAGDKLMIRMNIDQYLSGGSCKLMLSQNGEVYYTASAPVVDSVATSVCEGFDVPAGQVPSGKTNIVILVNSGEKSGEIVGEASL